MDGIMRPNSSFLPPPALESSHRDDGNSDWQLVS